MGNTAHRDGVDVEPEAERQHQATVPRASALNRPWAVSLREAAF
jgi:hypothetical protein